jgi:hypothetical protein
MPSAFEQAGDRLDATLFGPSVPADASSDVSDGAAAFRSEDEQALAIPLTAAVSRQEAALAVTS